MYSIGRMVFFIELACLGRLRRDSGELSAGSYTVESMWRTRLPARVNHRGKRICVVSLIASLRLPIAIGTPQAAAAIGTRA